MNYLPLLVIVLLLAGMLALSARNRRRATVAELERAERIGVGSDVMTTSGLHGTVVGVNGDGTVALSVAPGIEVRWELAALRDVSELPGRYVHDGETADKRSGADPA